MTIRTSILSVILLLCTSAVAQESFDHYSTGFELEGAHQNVSCDRCHSGGIFEGTNPNCVGCHSQIGTVLSSMKPAGHVTSAETCDSCHTTSAWSPIYYMDHMAVSGSCGTCHNGNSAQGKPPGHIVSGDNCDDCHNSSLWVPAVFDHANITRELLLLPQRFGRDWEGQRTHQHGEYLRGLPQQLVLGPGARRRSHAGHRHLLQLPQRTVATGKDAGPYHQRRQLRRLPHDRRLDARQFRPCEHHGQLRQLS